jgi:hypothetical protein
MKKIALLLACLWVSFNVLAQEVGIKHTMGYYRIEIKPTKAQFFKRYMAPGKEPICGFYSAYNKTMYLCTGGKFEVANEDYLYDGMIACCEKISFNDGPKPYAMMELEMEVTKVDYETNKIYGKVDGAEVVIETFNKEIDEFYNKFYKSDRLGIVRVKLLLKNWTYEPEAEKSYAENSKKIKRSRWKTKRAKNKEKYMHESEYMK